MKLVSEAKNYSVREEHEAGTVKPRITVQREERQAGTVKPIELQCQRRTLSWHSEA